MKKSTFAVLGLVAAIGVVFFFFGGCEKPPPPYDAQKVFENLREGFMVQDAFTYCRDFGEGMFQDGNSLNSYQAEIRKMTNKIGQWQAEKYLGEGNGPMPDYKTYHWKIYFSNDKRDLFLTLDDKNKVYEIIYRP